MKPSLIKSIIATAALAILPRSFQLYAQNVPSGAGQIHYSVINLGTLGGSFAEGNGVSNKGLISGFSTLPGDQSTHAILWTEATGLQDLGTLGGPNSSISFPVKDSRGLLVGGADTSLLDPFNEGICGGAAAPFATPDPFICRGFLFEAGKMAPLATLGGNNSFAENVNDQGQIVGFAETADPDPNCMAPQVFDLQPVIWGPKEGQIEALPQLPGDIFGAATGINDKGQIVGVSSGFCAPGAVVTTIESHIVLWEKRVPANLGSLGGVANNFPFAINNRGDVVGMSDVTGDTTSHAFLWTKEKGMQDLGTLPGGTASVALGMNNKGQVVGGSADANGNGSAFLWEDGVMTDLNTLVCGSSLFLDFGGDINDHGEISGQAIDPSTGSLVGFLAIPIHDADDCQANPLSERKVGIPENARAQLRRRFGLGR